MQLNIHKSKKYTILYYIHEISTIQTIPYTYYTHYTIYTIYILKEYRASFMYYPSPILIVLIRCNPLIIKSRHSREDRPADPDGVITVW